MVGNYSLPEPSNVSLGYRKSGASPEPNSRAEPQPKWFSAIVEWGASWELHQYGLGGVFALLAAGALVLLLRRGGTKKRASLVILTLVALFGLTRSLCLCIDAYNHKRWMPAVAFKLLWGIGNPCLVSAFSMVFVVLRNALSLKQAFRAWYTTRNVVILASIYFFFVFIAEIVLQFVPFVKEITFVCQMMYVLFSFCLILFYSVISMKFKKSFYKVQQQSQGVDTKSRVAWMTPKSRSKSRDQAIVLRLLIATVLGGLTLLCMQLYSIASANGVFSGAQYIAAWEWFGFNTLMRIVEIYLAALLFLLAVRKQNTNQEKVVKNVEKNSTQIKTNE